MDHIGRAMLKNRLFLGFKIRKLRAEFDGKTQAVRGALIAELEELHGGHLRGLRLFEMKS